MFSKVGLEAAGDIVLASMSPTPQYAWPLLAERTGCEVWVKHENHTPTGAFKVRGGLVYMESLWRSRQASPGLVTATRGNHGQSLPYAARRYGVAVTVCVPQGNSPEKNAAMRALGAELIEAGDDFDQAREQARRIAAERGLTMVPPFHPDLVRGVATYALELLVGVPDLDTVYVPVGMGSGICGLIRTRDLLGLRTRIVGVVSAHAPAMALSFETGEIVRTATAHTFADGMACREPDPAAFAIIAAGADRIVQVTDGQVAAAIRAYWADTHNLPEGAGAAPLAALLHERESMRGKRVALILSGANIDSGSVARVLAGNALGQEGGGHEAAIRSAGSAYN